MVSTQQSEIFNGNGQIEGLRDTFNINFIFDLKLIFVISKYDFKNHNTNYFLHLSVCTRFMECRFFYIIMLRQINIDNIIEIFNFLLL